METVRQNRELRALGDELPDRKARVRVAPEADRAEDQVVHEAQRDEVEHQGGDADVDALLSAGIDDGQVLEANQIICYFNYVNRSLNGLGVTTDNDVVGYYAKADSAL